MINGGLAPTAPGSSSGLGSLGAAGAVANTALNSIPIAGPLVSGGLSLLGGLFQQSGQQASISQQESFQQQMSSSAFQRAVADEKDAGLNPALMYGSGGPESTPSGASMTPPNVLGAVSSSAMDTMTMDKQFQVQDSVVNLNKANQAAALASAAKTSASMPLIDLENSAARGVQPVVNALVKVAQSIGNQAVSGAPGAVGKLAAQAQNVANQHTGIAPPGQDYTNPGASQVAGWDSAFDQFEKGVGIQ